MYKLVFKNGGDIDYELNNMAKNGGWHGENYTYNNIYSINDLIHNTKKLHLVIIVGLLIGQNL